MDSNDKRDDKKRSEFAIREMKTTCYTAWRLLRAPRLFGWEVVARFCSVLPLRQRHGSAADALRAAV